MNCILDQTEPIKRQFAFTASNMLRTPQFCAAIVVFFALLVETQGSPQCSTITEFTIFYPGNQNAEESCQECAKCSVGYGLPRQCGSRVPHGTSTNCIRCGANTYSDTNDSSSCRPCKICKGTKVLTQCTSEQDRVCDTACLPNYHLDYKEDPPKCTLSVTTVSSRPPVRTEEKGTQSSDNDNKGNVTLYVILGVVAALAIMCLIIAIYTFRGRSQSKCEGDESKLKLVEVQNPESPSNLSEGYEKDLETVSVQNTESPANFSEANVARIPIGCLVSEMERLCDDKGNVMLFYVQNKLDALQTHAVKTWRGVGQALGVSPDDLDLIETDYVGKRSPTESLIGKLKTLSKEPTMKAFVQTLVNCKRNDVANYICNWPWEKRFTS